MTLQANIDKLKKTVLHTQDLNKAWNAFFDLTMHPNFLDNSRPCHLENLEAILNEVYKSMMSDNAGKLQAPLVLRCSGTDFYHGPFISNGKPGTFLYFNDAGIGMAMLAASSINTEICRFTANVVQSPHCFIPTPDNNGQATFH